MKKFLTINEISEKLGVPASKLRYWESEFISFLRPERDSRNRRLYSRHDLDTLKRIRHLLDEEKYTIQGARRKLARFNYVYKEKIATALKSALFDIEHGIPLNTVVEKYLVKLG